MLVAVRAALIALGLAALFSGSWAQQTYRWVDKEGHVHYTQQPPARDAAKSVQQKKIGGGSVVESQIPFSLQQAIKNYPVTLYTSPSCKQGCPEARELLSKRGIPYSEVSVSDSQTNDLLIKATGDNKVPALTVGTLAQKGYQAEAMHSALDAAGYPRTPVFAGKLPVPAAAPQRPAPIAPNEATPPASATQEPAKP
jgi:glutaredoxin